MPAGTRLQLPRLLYLPLVAFLLVCPRAPAQRVGFITPKWANHTVFWVSSDRPMLRHMQPLPGFNASVRTLVAHVTSVEQDIFTSLANTLNPQDDDDAFVACSIVNKKFGPSIDTMFGIRGLPQPTYDCTTDVTLTHSTPRAPANFSVDAVYDAVERLRTVLDEQKRFFIANVIQKWPPAAQISNDWMRAASLSVLPFNRPDKQCEVGGVSLKRVGSRWFVDISITNAQPTDGRGHLQRQSLREEVHIDARGVADVLQMRVPTYGSEAVDGPSVNDSTTTLTRGGGIAVPGDFYPVYQWENPALLAAVDEADRPIRQVLDALTPSSLSLLLLPLLLNLVPVALITQVSPRVMFTYMLLSDVVTVIPLLIKGCELVVIGSQRFRAVTVRVENDLRGVLGDAAAAQLWTAECRAKNHAGVYGAVFVAISVVAVVVGVWFELLARRFVRRRQRRHAELRAVYYAIGSDETYETYDVQRGRRVPQSAKLPMLAGGSRPCESDLF